MLIVSVIHSGVTNSGLGVGIQKLTSVALPLTTLLHLCGTTQSFAIINPYSKSNKGFESLMIDLGKIHLKIEFQNVQD